MEISVHDNVLISYEVLAEIREVRLHTKFTGGRSEYTDIIFRGVEGYYFYNDNFQTIIFDITEIPVDKILEIDRERFDEGWRFGWPGSWNSDSELARKAYLAEKRVKGFELSSTVGMNGWVLAGSMERVLGAGP